MVAENPNPPNQPRAFCAPCAKKITPRIRRRIVMAGSSVVLMSLRNMGTPPLLEEKIRTQGNRAVTPISLGGGHESGKPRDQGGLDPASAMIARAGGRTAAEPGTKLMTHLESSSAVGVAVTALRIPDPRRRRLGGHELSLACHSTW